MNLLRKSNLGQAHHSGEERGACFLDEGRKLGGQVLNKRSLEDRKNLGLWQPLIGWVVAGQGENLPLPAGGYVK